MPFSDITLNDGHGIPGIAYGSGSANKCKDVQGYVEQAIEAGFSHLDTAQIYGNEDSVGKAIRDAGLERSQMFITTKYSDNRATVRESITSSLDKLGLKYVDLYLIHSPQLFPQYVEVWKDMVQLREGGLTKSIGVSNFGREHLETILEHSKVVPATNQIELHLYNYAKLKELLEYHATHGIVTEAYGSLAPITKYRGGPVDKPLQEAATRLGITITQVIFLWLQSKGIVIVTTTSKKERLEEYYAVGDLPPLTPEEIQALEEAGAKGPPSVLWPCLLLLVAVVVWGHVGYQATRSWRHFWVYFGTWLVIYLIRRAFRKGKAWYIASRETRPVLG